ncbi:hypothetical protein C2G38_2066261 [Gigaspora rosea]|uniref:TLDc domain-containing protein n=1 Tax=Gigaspora rosea TaxID=44941 RepID=A0A397VTM4_9GLOM|nr:hypothetical protein C2G38_2066261 [Gigaspora rosea]
MIFDSDDLITLQENALISLIKDDELQMEESEIWDKVILWGKAKTPNLPFELEQWTDKDFKSLKVTLQHCLPYIRYFQMSDEDIVKKIKPYRNILEKSLWDDILINRLVPDMIITSQILPPRKNSSSQLLPQREFMITLNSSIITLQHAAEISSWIDRRSTIYNITKIPYKFKLLLRGSRNGFDAVSFHMRCDNIPNTLIVLKVRDSNELLGGYNPLIWNAGDGYARTSDSFVFSLANGNLNKSILSRVSDASSAICQSSLSQGPWFGDNDLGMSDSTNPKKWLCKKYAYEKPIRSSEGWFFVDEYEVFQICKTFKS